MPKLFCYNKRCSERRDYLCTMQPMSIKIVSRKDEVFDYFKLPADTDINKVNDYISDKWEVVKLTAPTRKKLEKYFGKSAKELEEKGQYLGLAEQHIGIYKRKN